MLRSCLIFIPAVSIFFCNSALSQENQLPVNAKVWKFSSQRAALTPQYFIDSESKYNGSSTLVISGGGSETANGCWQTNIEVEALKWYEFRAHFRALNIDEVDRSILARILWYDDQGKQIARAEYPRSHLAKTADKWSKIHEIYQVPEGATRARIELVYRWDADGEVRFGGIFMSEIVDPGERIVKLATIHHRPRNSSGPKENLEQFAKHIKQAAEQGADIVCMPEGSTMVGTGLDYIAASEPIPGPATDFLGDIAHKNSMYIIAGMLEKDGEAVYNTSVLIDRKGEISGKYRKVSLPREEIEGGVTPGDEFPVFETDFGKIGMMICWDVTFPEAARTLAFQGAEVIFLPIWGGHLTLAKARALENQVYLVSSTYSMKSAVFDQEGEIIEEATKENPVVVVEVDLNQRKYWPWLGDFKNRIKREMPSQKAQTIGE